MISSLPIEVVLVISGYLSVKDRIALISTCRRLNDIISKRNLFDGLDLRTNFLDLEEAIKRFEGKNLDGSQVKTLCTNLEVGEVKPPARLSTLFPNVTRVITRSSPIISPKPRTRYGYHYTFSEPMSTWINTIERYNSFTDWYDIRETLRSREFPRLKELEIGMYKYFGDIKEGFHTLRFLPYIKNAPSLTKLVLNKSDIDLEFLEKVHSSCPLLETLVLKSVIILINDPLPQTILPAARVLHLEIEHPIMLDENCVFLDYILKKYPNLQYLEFNRNESEPDAEDELIEYYPTYKVDDYGSIASESSDDGSLYEEQSTGNRNILNGHLDVLESTNSEYHYPDNKFIPHLPKTIKILKIGIDISEKIFESLLKSCANLTLLDFLHCGSCKTACLKNPNQLALLKNLTSLRTMKIAIDQKTQRYNAPFASTTITKLFVKVVISHLDIDWLLSMFPSLEELYIRQSYSGIKRKDSKEVELTRVYPNLHTLHILNGPIDSELLDHLKETAPNIKDLNLSIKMDQKTFKFDLCGWNLNYCILYNEEFWGRNVECSITTQNKTTECVWFTDNRKVFLHRPPKHRIEPSTIIKYSLICGDIKHLKVNYNSVQIRQNKITILK